MTPEDRELLEAAAKAAGVPHKWNQVWGGFFVQKADGSWERECWNPLTDDGDALRLAVSLGMNVHVIRDDGTFVSRYEHEPVIAEKRGSDPYAATRRAIVRAAAAIGKEMT